MSFLSIAFLLALPLAAAPLLLHFFDRRRQSVIEWGAMQFLLEASARKTSARRLKQWLLLLLRVLAIAALVFALARPLLPAGTLGGNRRSESIFVIDNSMSMMRQGKSDSLFADAIDETERRLTDLAGNERARFLTTAPYPVWIERVNDLRNSETSASPLRQLAATEGRSDLLAGLFTAIQAEQDPTTGKRRIVVLTDGQTADWRLEDSAGWSRLNQLLNASPIPTEIDIVRVDQAVDQSSVGNIAVEEVSIGRSIVGVGQPITATANLKNYDIASSRPSSVTWTVDDLEFHRQSIESIEGEQSVQTNWSHTFDSPGIFRLSCSVESEDDLLADNHASLVVEVVDRIPIVIVEGSFELSEMQQDSYFVQAALGWIDEKALDGASIYSPTLVSPDELATLDLAVQRVVLIPNLTRLENDAVEKLTEFVNEGGGLWIGLGPRTDIDTFNHQLFADASGLSPVRIDHIVDSAPSTFAPDDQSSSHRVTRIDPFRSEHPAMAHLANDNQLDLGDALVQRRFQFDVGEKSDELSVLLTLNNGQPLAVENFLGRGRVVVQAVPLRLQWSDLARTQSFVILVRDCVDYLAQPRATQYNLQPGEPIVLQLPEQSSFQQGSSADEQASASFAQANAPTGLLATPQGDAIELTAEQHEAGFVFRSSRTRVPGQYELEVGLAERRIPFQVQRELLESNLDSLTAEGERRINAAITPNPAEQAAAETASAQSDPLWPYLLVGLIVLIAGELVLSGLLARERFGSVGVPDFADLDTSLQETTPFSSPSSRRDASLYATGAFTSDLSASTSGEVK